LAVGIHRLDKVFICLVSLRIQQGYYKEAFAMLQECNFPNISKELVDLWDEAHYKEKESLIQRQLTPLIRFRIRQKFPPPCNICPQGLRMTNTLPSAARQHLKRWLDKHNNNPYPSKAEKTELAYQTSLTVHQVRTWFANARRRQRQGQKKMILDNDEKDENAADEVIKMPPSLSRAVPGQMALSQCGVDASLYASLDDFAQPLASSTPAENRELNTPETHLLPPVELPIHLTTAGLANTGLGSPSLSSVADTLPSSGNVSPTALTGRPNMTGPHIKDLPTFFPSTLSTESVSHHYPELQRICSGSPLPDVLGVAKPYSSGCSTGTSLQDGLTMNRPWLPDSCGSQPCPRFSNTFSPNLGPTPGSGMTYPYGLPQHDYPRYSSSLPSIGNWSNYGLYPHGSNSQMWFPRPPPLTPPWSSNLGYTDFPSCCPSGPTKPDPDCAASSGQYHSYSAYSGLSQLSLPSLNQNNYAASALRTDKVSASPPLPSPLAPPTSSLYPAFSGSLPYQTSSVPSLSAWSLPPLTPSNRTSCFFNDPFITNEPLRCSNMNFSSSYNMNSLSEGNPAGSPTLPMHASSQCAVRQA